MYFSIQVIWIKLHMYVVFKVWGNVRTLTYICRSQRSDAQLRKVLELLMIQILEYQLLNKF